MEFRAITRSRAVVHKTGAQWKRFPDVWNTLLKGHALVDGLPRQRHDGAPSPLDMIELA